MEWREGDHVIPVGRLGLVLGALAGLVAGCLAQLRHADWLTTALLVATAGGGAAAGVLGLYAVDVLFTAVTASRLRRARMRAARAIYNEWATTPAPKAAELRELAINDRGRRYAYQWLEDDQPNAYGWRQLLGEMLRWAQTIWQQTGGTRTGLTEADLVGEGRMFATRRPYAEAVKVLTELGLASRMNGVPTSLAEGWTYPQAALYLRTAATLPEGLPPPPQYARLPGRGWVIPPTLANAGPASETAATRKAESLGSAE